jgi:hypothetical protein
VPLLL